MCRRFATKELRGTIVRGCNNYFENARFSGVSCVPGRLDGVRPEFDGGKARQLPVQPALRGARTGQDDNIAVVRGIGHGNFLPIFGRWLA